MNKVWHEVAWKDYLYWQAQGKKMLRKINSLLKEIDCTSLMVLVSQRLCEAIYLVGGAGELTTQIVLCIE